MYRPASTPTSTLPYSNGHLSPPSNNLQHSDAMTPESESDLSEAIDPQKATSISSEATRRDGTEKGLDRPGSTESLHEEDAMGSDDIDYDMDTPSPADPSSPADDARSSSQDSRRNGKRKAGADHDDFMLENPELYGLRRSVGDGLCHVYIMLIQPPTGSCSSVAANSKRKYPSPISQLY